MTERNPLFVPAGRKPTGNQLPPLLFMMLPKNSIPLSLTNTPPNSTRSKSMSLYPVINRHRFVALALAAIMAVAVTFLLAAPWPASGQQSDQEVPAKPTGLTGTVSPEQSRRSRCPCPGTIRATAPSPRLPRAAAQSCGGRQGSVPHGR